MRALMQHLSCVLAGYLRAKQLLPDEIERELDYHCETLRGATWAYIRDADQ
jgi:hypothetical protein